MVSNIAHLGMCHTDVRNMTLFTFRLLFVRKCFVASMQILSFVCILYVVFFSRKIYQYFHWTSPYISRCYHLEHRISDLLKFWQKSLEAKVYAFVCYSNRSRTNLCEQIPNKQTNMHSNRNRKKGTEPLSNQIFGCLLCIFPFDLNLKWKFPYAEYLEWKQQRITTITDRIGRQRAARKPNIYRCWLMVCEHETKDKSNGTTEKSRIQIVYASCH